MYVRKIDELPDSFVKDHKPVFGTFRGHPERLDIRGVFKPFGTLPLPCFITNLRIKSRLIFFFNIAGFAGKIKFFDAKIFGFSEVVMWNKETAQKFVWHSVMGPRKRIVPHNLNKGSSRNFSRNRYTKISWDREKGFVNVILNLKGSSGRPDFSAEFEGRFDSPDFCELTAVRPYPTKRRCSASYCASLPLSGKMEFSGKTQEKKSFAAEDGIAFFNMKRSYMKYRSHGEYVIGFGTVKGKSIGFRIAAESHEAVDNDCYNGNVLFLDGKVTPLPPVRITHHFGLSSAWVIQDTENMVDLTFNPVSIANKKISVFVLRTVYNTIYGTFEGTFVDSEGEKISFKSLDGVGESYLLRL